jgi:hypothetical protein
MSKIVSIRKQQLDFLIKISEYADLYDICLKTNTSSTYSDSKCMRNDNDVDNDNGIIYNKLTVGSRRSALSSCKIHFTAD